ncbi:MAG: CDP-alcohol phosphatidyltransferase family protein, partial [Actinobacteria bacterium]|nr:CDP-alcohol phosphatidyltransferase family protein [Actinomycetota bacterium]
ATNEALERRAATRWAKRIFVLPIGERFALISLTAAVATPRVTFVALVAWGGVAAVYALGARTATAVAE